MKPKLLTETYITTQITPMTLGKLTTKSITWIMVQSKVRARAKQYK